METLVGRSQNVNSIIQRKKKTKKIIIISIAVILITGLLLGITYNYYINKRYNSYEVEKNYKFKNSGDLSFVSYKESVIKYSKDGIAALDGSGKELWNGSYDMASPALDICGDYVVAADIGAKKIVVFNGEDSGKEFTTDYPIVQAEVSKQGVVAVLLEEKTANVIRMYNPYDAQNTLLAEIPTNIDDGYPVSIDISADGVNVAAVYVSVNNSKIQSRVAFYNFSDVGKNSNFLVGAQNYDDKLVSEVEYINDTDVCVFGEDGYSIWTNPRQPEQKFEKKYRSTIKSAFYNSKYIGVVLSEENDKTGEMEVYDLSGKRKLRLKIEEDYTDISLNEDDEIMMNSESQSYIYRMNGIKKFSSSINGKLRNFFKAKGDKSYYFVLENEIQEIKLKKNKKRG